MWPPPPLSALLLLLLSLGPLAAAPPPRAEAERPWLDATLPIAQRVSKLMAQMTLQEKAAQLLHTSIGIGARRSRASPPPSRRAGSAP